MTLNPLLRFQDIAGQRIEEAVVEHAASFRTRGKLSLAQLAVHGTARTTFITDHPHKEIRVMLDYGSRLSGPGISFPDCCIEFGSEKPLAIGTATDWALNTKTM
jgi:hypothetical protein